MNDKVAGLVLTCADYKEADVLLQVSTKEYGIISLVGKAAKKLASRNHFFPFCIYEFIIDHVDGRSIFSIHGSKLLGNYAEDSDLLMIAFKNVLCQLAVKNREIDCYDELCFVFANLDHEHMHLLGSMFLAHLIRQFGITPVVDHCALCQEKKVVAVSNRHGGFLCQKHLSGEKVQPVDVLKRFRLIIKGGFKDYEILKQFDYGFRDFCLLMDFFLENADLSIKAYDFYRSLN